MDEPLGQAQGSAVPDVTAPAEVQEKMLRQSEVNDLIGKAKHAYFEKGRRDAHAEHAQQSTSGNLGGMPQLTEDQVRQMIADEAHKQTNIQAAHSMLSNFSTQMGASKSKYSDFDETVGNLGNLQNMPHVVHMAAETGMAGDIMYELGKNPGKVATLTTLSYVNPHLAKVEMQKLAESIKKNDEARQSPEAQEPLSRMSSSTVGTDNGSHSIRDLRKKSWARV